MNGEKQRAANTEYTQEQKGQVRLCKKQTNKQTSKIILKSTILFGDMIPWLTGTRKMGREN